jgi:iron complex transport system substrate-binding protein
MTRQHALTRVSGLAVLSAALAFCSAGCGDRSAVAPDNAGSAGPPQRIVCASPSATEIVFALGCVDRVVGVSDYTVYPPEAKAKERIGGWMNPNRERLLALKPDIIVTQGNHEKLAAFADEYGIRFLSVKVQALADICAAIDTVGRALGNPDRAKALTEGIRGAVQSVREKVAGRPPKRVLLLLARSPGSLSGMGTVGPGTFLEEMIRAAGGVSVFADAKGGYPQVSKESILVRSPEVILELHPGGLTEETTTQLRADWEEFKQLSAVRNGRVHFLTNDFLLIPGPRVALIAERLAQTMHPELADD